MFKKFVSIILPLFTKISAFTQLYAGSLDITNSYKQKKIIQTEKANYIFVFDEFENEGENKNVADFLMNYFLLPISFILNFGFSSDYKNELIALRIT